MTTGFSKKIIALSENNTFLKYLKETADKNDLEVIQNYENITDTASIKNTCMKTGNTSFIRSELLSFIKENGYPAFIALDLRIPSGLEAQNDHDSMKILRTFLISNIIISRGKSFSNFQSNIMILYKGNDSPLIDRINQSPVSILNHIKTNDKMVNTFITDLKEEPKKFNQLFYIKTVNSDNASTIISNEINIFIKTVNARLRLQRRAMTETSELDMTNTEAAIVVYRITDGVFYVDGKITSEVPTEYHNLEKNILYIIGAWSNKTQSIVSSKIIMAVTKGLGEEKSFEKEERIIIDAGERCTVDATTTVSIAQTLSRDLYAYKNIIINLNNENRLVLEKTKGFSLISKQVRTL